MLILIHLILMFGFYSRALNQVCLSRSLLDHLSLLPSDVPLVSTLVSAPYSGCMEVSVNGQSLDLDKAIHKHNDIRSHSCPLLDSNQWPLPVKRMHKQFIEAMEMTLEMLHRISLDKWGIVMNLTGKKGKTRIPGLPRPVAQGHLVLLTRCCCRLEAFAGIFTVISVL